jgi:RNA polymerase sigma-70 factor (ECF subfamily)
MRGNKMGLELSLHGGSGDSEDTLAVRCRNGDRAAFDEIVSRYTVRLFRFAFRLLGDRSEAEDAVQETFVRVYKAIPAYRPDGYFSSWIYRIALNECRRRRRNYRITLPLEAAPQVASGPDPQQSAMTAERNRVLRLAVEALPEHYRIVMMLFYFDELSVDEISRTIDVSVSAVKVRLHRGRERLAVRLQNSL